MNIEEAIAKKEDIEYEIAQKLNAFTQKTGLRIERVEIHEKRPKLYGYKDEIQIALDVRL